MSQIVDQELLSAISGTVSNSMSVERNEAWISFDTSVEK